MIKSFQIERLKFFFKIDTTEKQNIATSVLSNTVQPYCMSLSILASSWKKKLHGPLRCLYPPKKQETCQRHDWLSVHLEVFNFSPLPFQKLCPSWSVTIQTFCPPSAVVPSDLSTLNRKIPWVCLGACWLSEVQWTAQIAWGVENSFVNGALLSAKARWSFTVAALSMWNCFFSQETQGFAPTSLSQ